MGELLQPMEEGDGAWRRWGRITYDLAFFIIVNVILMNIVFGIIVDTFQRMYNHFIIVLGCNCDLSPNTASGTHNQYWQIS